MALWKDSSSSAKPPSMPAPETLPAARVETVAIPEPRPELAANSTPALRTAAGTPRPESLIAPDIAIEGRIEGAGHVRIAGKFKGDIDVRGDLSIEPGAKVNGSVRADKVGIAGELVGNIEAASHVDLVKGGALTGDLKAASLAVAAGSRMRGLADFGWDEAKPVDQGRKGGNGPERGASQ